MAGDVTMTGDDFGNQSQAFLDWFKSLPGATFHPDITLVDLRDRGAGRGVGKSPVGQGRLSWGRACSATGIDGPDADSPRF